MVGHGGLSKAATSGYHGHDDHFQDPRRGPMTSLNVAEAKKQFSDLLVGLPMVARPS